MSNNRRRKIVRIPARDVLGWFGTAANGIGNSHLIVPKLDGLPPDAEVIAVQHDFHTNNFDFLVTHESFDIVPDGERAPEVMGIGGWERVSVVRPDEMVIPKLAVNVKREEYSVIVVEPETADVMATRLTPKLYAAAAQLNAPGQKDYILTDSEDGLRYAEPDIVGNQFSGMAKVIGDRPAFTADTPQFQHDCDKCQFLGRYNGCDLYYADHGGLPDTVIARYGNEGSEYTSGMSGAVNDDRLAEAKRRAIQAGLIPDDNAKQLEIPEITAWNRTNEKKHPRVRR